MVDLKASKDFRVCRDFKVHRAFKGFKACKDCRDRRVVLLVSIFQQRLFRLPRVLSVNGTQMVSLATCNS